MGSRPPPLDPPAAPGTLEPAVAGLPRRSLPPHSRWEALPGKVQLGMAAAGPLSPGRRSRGAHPRSDLAEGSGGVPAVADLAATEVGTLFPLGGGALAAPNSGARLVHGSWARAGLIALVHGDRAWRRLAAAASWHRGGDSDRPGFGGGLDLHHSARPMV
jgi:hypothetical protein